LTAIAGGWDELRLFYATTGEMLAGVYRDDRCGWAPSGCFCCYSISLRPLLTKRCPQLSKSQPTSSSPRPCCQRSPGTTLRPILRCVSSPPMTKTTCTSIVRHFPFVFYLSLNVRRELPPKTTNSSSQRLPIHLS
jgi:hypothetical protein